MSFINKHKIMIILIIVFVVLMIVTGICAKKLFFSNNSNGDYGNRLDGIDQVRITDSRIDNAKGKLLNNKNCNTVTLNVGGRIIKTFIEVKSGTDELSIEEMLNVIISNFTDEEKAFYDFQVFVTNEAKEDLYPMIAYKHRNRPVFTVTKKVGEKNEE